MTVPNDDQSSIFFAGANDYTRTYSPTEMEHTQRVACFCTAIKTGNETIVKTLIDEGFDINETIELADRGIYARPLTTAIMSGQERIAEALIAKGAEVGNASLEIPTFGTSEILSALSLKPEDAVPHLLAIEAIRSRIAELGDGADRDNNALQKFIVSRSPLASACYVKSKRLVEMLLDAGAEFGEYYYMALTAVLDETVECTDDVRLELVGMVLGARDRIGFDRFVGATQDFEQYVNGEWRRGFAGEDYNPAFAAQEKAWEACDRILTSPSYKKRLPLSQLLYAKYRDLTLDDVIQTIVEVSRAVDGAENLEALTSTLLWLDISKFCGGVLSPIRVNCTVRPIDGRTVLVATPKWKNSEEPGDALSTTILPLVKEKAPDIEFDDAEYRAVVEEVAVVGGGSAMYLALGKALGSELSIGDFKSLFDEDDAKRGLRSLALTAYPALMQGGDEGAIFFDKESIERVIRFWNEDNLEQIKNYVKCQYASSFSELIEAKAGNQSRAEQFSTFSALCGPLISRELSPAYLESVLDEKAIDELQGIFRNIKAAYRIAIDKSGHLSDESREKALGRLDGITLKIVGTETAEPSLEGNLIIDDWDFIDNVNRLYNFTLQKQYQDAQSADGEISNATVGYSWLYNAAYDIQRNDVELYAAYLLPPAYSSRRASAMNYAAIGRVIGHEISHAFDPKAVETLKALTGELDSVDIFSSSASYASNIEKLKKQFAGKVPRRLLQAVPVLSVRNDFDSDRCVGENFADVVGLEIALFAYAISRGYETVGELVGHETGDVKQFMQSYALSFRSKPSKEWLMYQMMYDEHAPNEFRANTVKNVDAFHAVFGTKEGDGMWLDPEERVSVFGIE